MSLLPYVFGSDWPLRSWNTEMSPIFDSGDFHPWRQLARLTQDLDTNIKSDTDKFQVNVDVQHFAPEEIVVKTVDGQLIVEGKHEEKQDQHGYISRRFVRRYALPEGCHEESVQSRLSSDGVLTITAPKHLPVKGERAVPIQQTGPVRKEVTHRKEAAAEDAKK